MATWQQADVDAVRAAVLALATGKRVVTVNYAGPPARSVTYAPADLPQLRSLLAEMIAQVKGQTTFRRVGFKKGFDSCG